MTDNSINLNEQVSPVLEGFALQTTSSTKPKVIKQYLYNELGILFEVDVYGHQSTSFDITSEDLPVRPQDVWDMTYHLRQLKDVAYVEPLFAVAIDSRPDWTENFGLSENTKDVENFIEKVSSVFGSASTQHLEESRDLHWALKEMRVFEAWERFFPNRDTSPPGQGIIIGHPDTGYQLHPEIRDNLLPKQGYDYIDGKKDPDPLDELETPFGVLIPSPGHGTGAASVIISPEGGSQKPQVTGVAPGAKLIPYRITHSVVLWPQSVKNLAQSIERAARDGADIISVSIGAVQPSRRLREAVLEAQSQGVIILGAAGNNVPWVVPPASIPEVIAVAASNAKREIWSDSAFGRKVDVTAPGESVWRARAIKDQNNQVHFRVERSNGTTFSVALTAGVAALWLAHHGGREVLAQKLGGNAYLSKIPTLFKAILRRNCTPVSSWDRNKYGQGLVNAEETLAANINEYIDDVGMLSPSLSEVAVDQEDTLYGFQILFEQALRTDVVETDISNQERSTQDLNLQLSSLFNTSKENLREKLQDVGQELLFHLVTNPDSYKAFASTLAKREYSVDESGLSLPTTYCDAVRNSLLSKGLSTKLRTWLKSNH